jgi:GTPase SAR1 family protein
MDTKDIFVATETARELGDFLAQPGIPRALLLGVPATGKTATLRYLEQQLRSDGHFVLFVPLRSIGSLDALDQYIASIVLEGNGSAYGNPLANIVDPSDFNPIRRLLLGSRRSRNQFETLSELFRRIGEKIGPGRKLFLFLDGLDEMQFSHRTAFALESMAGALADVGIVVSSRVGGVSDQLKENRHFRIFAIQNLSSIELLQLVRSVGRQDISDASLQSLLSLSAGNPLVATFALNLLAAEDLKALTDKVSVEKKLGARIAEIYQRFIDSAAAGASVTEIELGRLLGVVAIVGTVTLDRLSGMTGVKKGTLHSLFNRLPATILNIGGDDVVELSHTLVGEYVLKTYLPSESIEVGALQFGDEAAERDVLLKANFAEPQYLQLLKSGTKTIVLGDRGAGKSAIFESLGSSRKTSEGYAGENALADGSTIIALSRNPADFVQQITADAGSGSSADRFRAIWLVYTASLIARELHSRVDRETKLGKTFYKEAVTLLRRIGWKDKIIGESALSKGMAVLRSALPEKASFTLGPVKVEPNWEKTNRTWFGTKDINIDRFLDMTERLLGTKRSHVIVVFDQIDEAFKYERKIQEELVQGLFLAESFLSMTRCIRLLVLLRTDLYSIYDIQEKNKFVSRTIRLEWEQQGLIDQLLQRAFSNLPLSEIIEALAPRGGRDRAFDGLRLQVLFPASIEGKPFIEWLFAGLENGRKHVAPRQIVLFLNLLKGVAASQKRQNDIPLFKEWEAAAALTILSEQSYDEVVSDFRVAIAFVRNCRVAKITDFKLEDVQELFDTSEDSIPLQVERLERLGFLERAVVPDGETLVSRMRIPSLFTRCWFFQN